MREQQLIISGVGGQGVLFITHLLSEAAIRAGRSVLTAETHGMAQRGGTVISHLKVGPFSSPMIRPGQADGLLSLKEDNLSQHGSYLKKLGWAVVNSSKRSGKSSDGFVFCADADAIAREIGAPRSVNLILLGVALGRHEESLFCSLKEVETVLSDRLATKKDLLSLSFTALRRGYMVSRQ